VLLFSPRVTHRVAGIGRDDSAATYNAERGVIILLKSTHIGAELYHPFWFHPLFLSEFLIDLAFEPWFLATLHSSAVLGLF
jgi:hypothetical protein